MQMFFIQQFQPEQQQKHWNFIKSIWLLNMTALNNRPFVVIYFKSLPPDA